MLKKPKFWLIFLALIFSGVYFWLATPIKTNTNLSPRFDWPDETANYYWAKSYAQSGQLAVFEPLNLVAKNQIHPRSFNVLPDGSLVPGSFLGLILFYGILAKIFSVKFLLYLTPLLAILGGLAFYSIIKKIFDQKVALLSTVLMYSHPAWWYYSVTPMLPNVAFVSLLLISIYFLFKESKNSFSPVLVSGLLFGLAIAIRPAEIIWVGFIYLIILIYLRHKFTFTKVALFLAIAFLAIFPTLYQQQNLYGSFMSSGYDQLSQPTTTAACQSCQIVKSLFLPFGFSPYLVAYNFWTHFLSRLWWLSLLALLGLIAFLTSPGKQKDEIFGYILVSLFLFIWLGAYYGSWQFSDLLTVSLNTLGVSYVRYWLPLYLLSLPFIAFGLLWLTSFFKNRFKNLALVFLLLLIIYPNAKLVLFEKSDSIILVKERIGSYKQIASQVINVTEPESVIITVRKDKVFFPERKVIHTFDSLPKNQELLGIIPDLAKLVPVYYYALTAENNLQLANNLHLVLIKNIGSEVLYRVILENNNLVLTP
ncbi:MAG: glycosyltransferase family 39 protein [Candidatus Buchananbacteria bacterium]